MIKSAAYKITVDGDLCLKMAKLLDEDKAPEFMKKNKIPLQSYYECRRVLQDIWSNGYSETINGSVSKIFEKQGFTINESGIGFKIA